MCVPMWVKDRKKTLVSQGYDKDKICYKLRNDKATILVCLGYSINIT